jgi:2,5-dihydroxypyridine 5,6-dioxygenase
MSMGVRDEHQIEIWKDVLSLCRVSRDETLIVLTGENSNPRNIDLAMRAAVASGATVYRLDLPPAPPRGPAGGDRASFLGVTPLTGNRPATDALKQADMVLDLMGLVHSPEQHEILASGTRILMVSEPPEFLAAMAPVADDKRRLMAADARLRAAKTMHVTSKAGTDFRCRLGQFKPVAEYGFADEPGHWDNWPSGFITDWPDEGSAQGRIVIDVGDILLPFKMYVTSQIVLEVKDGYIKSVEGGFEAKYLRVHMDSYNDPDAYGVAHLGWGLQPKAAWTGMGLRDKTQSHCMDSRAYYGNFLFSTGPNSEAGGSNNSRCHVDIPMASCSVSLDGEPITVDGRVVAADQKVDLR